MEGKLIKLGEDKYDLLVDFDPKVIEGYELSITNCQAIERGYDLDAIIKNNTNEYITTNIRKFNYGFEKGFQKALEILGDCKFTISDLKKAMDMSRVIIDSKYVYSGEEIYQSLQQAEWDVTFDPKEKDEEGRLILKKKITQNNYDSRTKS